MVEFTERKKSVGREKKVVVVGKKWLGFGFWYFEKEIDGESISVIDQFDLWLRFKVLRYLKLGHN